jgi:hypothetical protein
MLNEEMTLEELDISSSASCMDFIIEEPKYLQEDMASITKYLD